MHKAGVSHGSAIAGLAALFKKSPVGSRMPRSTSGNIPAGTPPATRAKPRKTSTPESPSVSSVKKTESSPSPRSSFKFKFRRKKGRMSRESSTEDVRGSMEDLRSETSSICSASKFSIKEEDLVASPKKESSPQAQSSQSLQPQPSKSSPKSVSDSVLEPHNDSVRSSIVFKEPVDIPSLFEEKTSLFDVGELDNILTKSATVFKEGSSQETKQKSSPSPKPKKANKSTPNMPSPVAAAKKPAPKPTKKPKVDLSLYEKKRSSPAPTNSPTASAKQRIALFEDKQSPKPAAWAKEKKDVLNSPIRKRALPTEQKQLAVAAVAQSGDKARSQTSPVTKEDKEDAAGKMPPLEKEEGEGGKAAAAVKVELTKLTEDVKVEKKEEEKAKVTEKKEEEKPEAPKEEKKTNEDKSVTKESQKPGESKAEESDDLDDQPNWKVMLDERQRKRRELQSEKKEKEISKPSASSLFLDTASAADDIPVKQSVQDEPKVGSDVASMKATLLEDELFQDEEPGEDQKAGLLDAEPPETEPSPKEQKAGEEEAASVPSSDAVTEKSKDQLHSPLLPKYKIEEPKEQAKADEEKKADNTTLFGGDSEQFITKLTGSPKQDRGTPKAEAKATETKDSSFSQTTSKDKKEADAVEVTVDPLGALEEGTSIVKEVDKKQEEKDDTSKPRDDDLFDKDDSAQPLPDESEQKDQKAEEMAPTEQPSPATKTAASKADKIPESKPQLAKTKDAIGKPSRLQTVEEKKTNKTSSTEKAPPKSPLKASYVESDDKPHWKKMLEEKRRAREQGTGTAAKQISSTSSEGKTKEEKPVLKVKSTPTKGDAKAGLPANSKVKPPPLKSVSQNDEDKKTDKSSAEPSPAREEAGSKESTPLSTPTRLMESAERKTPGVQETSPRHTSPRHTSPPSDSSIPKWKQDLLARKQAGTTAPLSPRRNTAEPQEKKEEKIPAWKQELLAKKKKQGNSSEVRH